MLSQVDTDNDKENNKKPAINQSSNDQSKAISRDGGTLRVRAVTADNGRVHCSGTCDVAGSLDEPDSGYISPTIFLAHGDKPVIQDSEAIVSLPINTTGSAPSSSSDHICRPEVCRTVTDDGSSQLPTDAAECS